MDITDNHDAGTPKPSRRRVLVSDGDPPIYYTGPVESDPDSRRQLAAVLARLLDRVLPVDSRG
jgi:hypothetical protein